MPLADHPFRKAIAEELHARPFPVLGVPGAVLFTAFKEPREAAGRDRAPEIDHLAGLAREAGLPMPAARATHYAAAVGKARLKWESHTEFVTCSLFTPAPPGDLPCTIEAASAPLRPWLDAFPGVRIAAGLVDVIAMPPAPEQMLALCDDWFVPESLAMAPVLDGSAVVAGDFRLDAAGLMRFVVFVRPGTGPRRVGRIVQHLCEIEIYRAMSMLGLVRARELGAELDRLDPLLSTLVSGLDAASSPEGALHGLLSISAELERLSVQHAFRFGATRAYEAILRQRIELLGETRIGGRQTFGEFMTRRYDPAMRTVESTAARLGTLSDRAARAAELLRTRVDVERSAQNQKILESMDRRADLALRLQHTVEGLSVVAISYYGVNLSAYLLAPLADAAGLSHGALAAALVLPVMAAVWLGIRRIRRRIHRDGAGTPPHDG